MKVAFFIQGQPTSADIARAGSVTVTAMVQFVNLETLDLNSGKLPQFDAVAGDMVPEAYAHLPRVDVKPVEVPTDIAAVESVVNTPWVAPKPSPKPQVDRSRRNIGAAPVETPAE